MSRLVTHLVQSLTVLCVLATATLAAPAFAKRADDTEAKVHTVAELQPGDRRLSCGALTSQIAEMNDIAAYGAPQTGKTSKGILGSVKRVGGKVAKAQVVRTVVSFTGPLGNLASSVIQGGQKDRDDALKTSARLRHDRLITLYDRKGCV